MQVTYHIPVALSTHGGATSFGQAYQSLHVAHASLQEGISLSPTLPDAMCVCVWCEHFWSERYVAAREKSQSVLPAVERYAAAREKSQSVLLEIS